MIPIEVQKRLDALALQYGTQFLAKLKAVFSQKKYRATGALAESLRLKITPSTAQSSPDIIIYYDEAGEYIGKKRLIYTKNAPMEAMLEYVKSPKFKMRSIPGYKDGTAANLSMEQKQERVAFALAKSKFTTGKHRRRKWKKEALPDLLKSMNDRLVRAWTEESEKIIAQSLTTR